MILQAKYFSDARIWRYDFFVFFYFTMDVTFWLKLAYTFILIETVTLSEIYLLFAMICWNFISSFIGLLLFYFLFYWIVIEASIMMNV